MLCTSRRMRLGRLASDAGIVEVKLFWLTSRLASTVKFPKESGIGPVRRLSLRANTLSRVRLPSSTGICPSNLLSPSSNTATDNKFKPSASSSHHSIVVLMVSIPNKLRSEIDVNYCSDLGGMEWWMGVPCKFESWPISGGMAPERVLLFKYRSVRLVKEERLLGMVPHSLLYCKNRPESAGSCDKVIGMYPVSSRPCNEMLATLPPDPTQPQKLS